ISWRACLPVLSAQPLKKSDPEKSTAIAARDQKLFRFARAIFLECIGQPYIEMHLFSIGSSHKVRLSSHQTFRGGEPNEIFRLFDFVFEMFVFCFDVVGSLDRSVRLAVANKRR